MSNKTQKEVTLISSTKSKHLNVLIDTLQKYFQLNTIMFDLLSPTDKKKLIFNFKFNNVPSIVGNNKLLADGSEACYKFCGIKTTVLTQVSKHGKNYVSASADKQKLFLTEPPPADYIPPKIQEYPMFIIPTKGLLGQEITTLSENTTIQNSKDIDLFKTKQHEREQDETQFSNLYARY